MQSKTAFIVAMYAAMSCVKASVYTDNAYFPEITKKEVTTYWNKKIDAASFIQSDFSCEKIHTGNTANSKDGVSVVYQEDWTTPSTIREPATLVVVPKNPRTQDFMLDVAYVDYTGIEDIPYGYPAAPCYILPPYKPLMYTAMYSPKEDVDVYALREEETVAESEKARCPSLDLGMLKTCQIVGPPVSHDQPTHTFFMSAGRKTRRYDISLYTAIRPSGLEWLKTIANTWDGPISAAVYVSDTKTIPEILNMWVNDKAMRDNVDIHFTYDVVFTDTKREKKAYPINYLRSVALKNTRTDIVMYLKEGQMIPSTLRSILMMDLPIFMDKKYTIHVVPEVEADPAAESVPLSKAAALGGGRHLVKGVTSDAIGEKRWKEAKEPYNIAALHREGFAPTYVSHRSVPLYDEAFGACGHAEAAHVADLRSMQYHVWVHPEAFVVRDSGAIAADDDESEGCESAAREAMRVAVLEARVDKLPGLLRNKHFPPWIRNVTLYDPKDPDAFMRDAHRRAAEGQDVDWTQCAEYTEEAYAAAELELAQLQETANNLILALGVVITAIAIMLISILLFKRRTPRKSRA